MARAGSEAGSGTDSRIRATLPEIRPRFLRLFQLYTRGYLRRHFHALRLSRSGRPPREELTGQPLVVYLNHPSWWDPLVALFLAHRLFGDRRSYGPIDAQALGRYGFFRRLGFFGVEQGSTRGARRFLAIATALLERPDTALWITPEGRFSDPRERPVRLEPGLAHLARRLDRGVFLPLALEYPFWQERTPEALAAFGEPVPAAELRGRPTEISADLAGRLEAAQDLLARDARERRAGGFDVLLSGRAGVGGLYDLWRALQVRLRGRRFERAHGCEEGGEDGDEESGRGEDGRAQ